MAAIDEILGQLSIPDVAQQLGVSTDEAEQAVRSAVPALIGGMQANAQSPEGAASLVGALGQHTGATDYDLGHADTADGEKIVAHVFGGSRNDVVQRLDSSGGGGGIMGKLLPMLAPIVLGYLADKFLGGGSSGSSGGGGGGLGDLLGGLTGGSDGGGGLGDLLGSLTGGSSGGSGGGGLGDIGEMLGGLLGGESSGDGSGSGSQQGGIDVGDLLGDLLGGGS